MARVPAHRARSRWPRRLLIGFAVVVVLGAAGAGAYALAQPHHTPAAAAVTTHRHGVVPLALVATTPSNEGSGVSSSATIAVRFSTAIDPGSPMPSLSPPVAGNWSALSSSELQFAADGPMVPGVHETLTVPGGPNGVLGADGQELASTITSSFEVSGGSTLRLQQLLAQLGYLPVDFVPSFQPSSPTQLADAQPGSFVWRWSTLPSNITSQWVPGQYGEITKAAVMTYEDQHNMTADGEAGPAVWASLLQSAAAGQDDTAPWDYVLVSKGSPETTTVYRNGANVYSTLANTGVPAAPTVDGTFAVFEHLTSTTMTGTNPDGSHYSDPNIPWVSYFNGGDALHGFIRGGYGYAQSDGCVEMPIPNAAIVFPMTPIGTLVTVAG
jgi:peptidoglycan hydrolase-like protein with peptidoglycan-binding domain